MGHAQCLALFGWNFLAGATGEGVAPKPSVSRWKNKIFSNKSLESERMIHKKRRWCDRLDCKIKAARPQY